MPGFRSKETDRHTGFRRIASDLPGRAVHPAGHIHRDNRNAPLFQHLEDGTDLLADILGESGSEQSIDHHIRTQSFGVIEAHDGTIPTVRHHCRVAAQALAKALRSPQRANFHPTRAAQIAAKKFMTEMDRLVLMSCLSNARMACDSTYLLDQEAREYSSKLDRLSELLAGLIEDRSRKIVIFSEWRRMLDRIEDRLEQLGAEFVRLDGQVPQKKRSTLVARFQNDADCRVICMTNAGSTGLNLQSANTVINIDLPWNPAVLEQRIARAHRMGQKNPVHVYKLVTVGPGNHETIEERLLDTLASKQELADASLNIDSDIDEVAMVSGMEDLKRRLEVILAPKEAAIDQSQQRRIEAETMRLADRKEKVSQASGTLISAALTLAGELVGSTRQESPDDAKVTKLQERLSECVDRDEAGRPQLKITLADDHSLRDLAKTLATLLQE